VSCERKLPSIANAIVGRYDDAPDGVYVFRSYATMTPSGTAAEDTKAFEALARRCASTVTVLTGRRRDVEGVAARSHSPRQSE